MKLRTPLCRKKEFLTVADKNLNLKRLIITPISNKADGKKERQIFGAYSAVSAK